MIELIGLEKKFGNFTLREIDLNIKKGEYFFFLGPSGSGKTVLLELIAGIQSSDRGRILIDGKDVTDVPIEKRDIGYACQDAMLFPFLNVRKNIEFGLKIKKYKKEVINRKVSDVSEMLGISHLLSRGVENLSGGEKQRVALARAIVTDPAILLLDEPLSKLDAKMASSLGRELEEVHNELGITMIQVTHNHAEALMLADRIGVINKGAVVQIGSPEEVFYSPKSKFVADFVDMENVFDGRIIYVDGIPAIRTPDFEVELPYSDMLELEIGEGSVTIGIRPEDIELVADPDRNILSGRVVDIHPSGSALYRVYVEVGNAVFVVDAPRRYASDIRTNSSVNMHLRPDAIRIIS